MLPTPKEVLITILNVLVTDITSMEYLLYQISKSGAKVLMTVMSVTVCTFFLGLYQILVS